MARANADRIPDDGPAVESISECAPKQQRQTKQAYLLELISREDGASLAELTFATGWLPHTTRAAISGLRKRGHNVQCKGVDGVSRYTVTSDGK